MRVLRDSFIMCVFILIKVFPLENFNIYAFVYSSSPKINGFQLAQLVKSLMVV